MKEPIYALDDLKRSYYLNFAVRNKMPILLEDLFGSGVISKRKADLWVRQAKSSCQRFEKAHLEPLKKSRGEELQTVNDLAQAAECISQELLNDVPPQIRAQLDEMTCGDYLFYRSCGFGKFWNEVPLPEIVEILFGRFCQLVGEDKTGTFGVSIYDMSDQAVVYSSEEQVVQLMKCYDLEPCEKMRLVDGAWWCC